MIFKDYFHGWDSKVYFDGAILVLSIFADSNCVVNDDAFYVT